MTYKYSLEVDPVWEETFASKVFDAYSWSNLDTSQPWTFTKYWPTNSAVVNIGQMNKIMPLTFLGNEKGGKLNYLGKIRGRYLILNNAPGYFSMRFNGGTNWKVGRDGVFDAGSPMDNAFNLLLLILPPAAIGQQPNVRVVGHIAKSFDFWGTPSREVFTINNRYPIIRIVGPEDQIVYGIKIGSISISWAPFGEDKI